MTLQDLGNLGEILGAVAVVVSLFYVGSQIRQNTAESGQNDTVLGSIVNLGTGIYTGSEVELSNNEPPASNQVAASTVRQLQ